MTREEAVKIFNTVLLFGKCDCPKEEIEECLRIAIKALEQEQCEDCISRQTLYEWLDGWKEKNKYYHSYTKNEIIPICEVIDIIQSLPPVSPQPKTGRWIYGIDEDTGEKDLYAWTCSECEGKYPWQPKYCPNCGAKMESGKRGIRNDGRV